MHAPEEEKRTCRQNNLS